MKDIYLAGPLFNAMEIERNLQLCEFLESNGFTVYLPQRDSGEFYGTDKSSAEIVAMDIAGVDGCKVVVACIDGRALDEGTVWEMGFGYALNKVVIRYKTDVRVSEPFGDNLMLAETSFLCTNTDDLLSILREVLEDSNV